jgi:hypothetical protein
MTKRQKKKSLGRFVLEPGGREIHGELTLAGKDTTLQLHDPLEFHLGTNPEKCIHGVLTDLEKVSLMDCVTMTGVGHTLRGGDISYSATIFPHFVVSGDHYLLPDDELVTHIDIVIDDAAVLFYDFFAFGFVLNATSVIEKVVELNEQLIQQKIPTGSDAAIAYFAGKSEIFACDTVDGKLTVRHRARPNNFGGPTGTGFKNTIVITIEFPKPLTLKKAIQRTSAPLRFFEILIGRPQDISGLGVRAGSELTKQECFEIHWSLAPRRTYSEPKPQSHDVLLDPIRSGSEFAKVLTNWLAEDAERVHARMRFSNSFHGQRYYTVDRLVGAANMFDLLPAGAVPTDAQISNDLEAAKEKARLEFEALPKSTERHSILSALGRIGKASLKHKIRHRAEKVTRVVGSRFPDLAIVTDEAVNCRNYYVHGSSPSFDYDNNFSAVVTFFTSALEFVFATSELVEAGWDMKRWSGAGTSMSHPFGGFLVDYHHRLAELKKLLS